MFKACERQTYVMYFLTIVTVFCCTGGVLSTKVSDSLKLPCEKKNLPCLANFLIETRESILKNGIPKLGVEKSDPLFIAEIDGDLPALKYKLFNTTFYGYGTCKVSNIVIKEDITSLTYDMNCEKITLKGKYEISGHLLTLPIEGNGDFKFITGKYLVKVYYEIEKYKSQDGINYVNVTNIKVKSATPQSPIKFEFTNLFNGQQDMSDKAHKYAQENWLEVTELIQGPIWSAAVDKYLSSVNKYLTLISFENIVRL